MKSITSAYKFELHTTSVDWSTGTSLPCERTIITNKHRTRKVVLAETAKALFIEEMLRKSLLSFLDVLHFCSLFFCYAFFFIIGFSSRLHCVRLL